MFVKIGDTFVNRNHVLTFQFAKIKLEEAKDGEEFAYQIALRIYHSTHSIVEYIKTKDEINRILSQLIHGE